MKLLFTAGIAEEYLKKIDEEILKLSFDVEYINERELQGFIEAPDCDILVCADPFSKLDFRKNTRLKAIILATTGANQIPDFLMLKEGVQVANHRGGYAVPIGEWIVMCSLMGLKNYPKLLKRQSERDWGIDKDIYEAYGKSILFLGSGSIAQVAATRLKACGMNTVAYRRSDKKAPAFDETINVDRLDEYLSKADIIASCLPDTSETINFIDERKLKLIKDDAVIINISRGTVLDEDALLKELKADRFRFIALDVFKNEPLDKNSELWGIDRVFISSHTSWVSQNRSERLFEHIVNNLKSFSETGKLIHDIDKRLKY